MRKLPLRRLLDAEDIIQSVLVRFLGYQAKNSAPWSSSRHLIAFVCAMAVNRIRDHVRQHRYEFEHTLDLSAEGFEGLVRAEYVRRCAPPNDRLDTSEQLKLIYEHFTAEELQTAKKWASGKRWTEIAASSGKKKGAARMSLARAFDRVRRILRGREK